MFILAFSVATVRAAPTSDPAAEAVRAYYAYLNTIQAAQRADIAHYTDIANQAAALYIQDGESIAATGDPMFVWELCDRAGGMRQIQPDAKLTDPGWKGIVLYGLSDSNAAVTQAQSDIAAEQKNGDRVIAFGNQFRLGQLRQSGVQADWEIVNRSSDDVDWRALRSHDICAPVNGIANMMAGWTFTAEFVGALTRLGKMPSMWQSIFVPGATTRDNALDKVKFYDTTPFPIPPGKLGIQYEDQLKAHLDEFTQKESTGIIDLSKLVEKADSTAGATVYFFGDGHADPHTLDEPGVPAKFMVKGDANTKPQAGDLVLFDAYNAPYAGPDWEKVADEAKAAGATVVFSFTDYDPAAVKSVPAGDLYIDQHWGLGDAEVTIPGYDVKVFPVSGIIEVSLVYAVQNCQVTTSANFNIGQSF